MGRTWKISSMKLEEERGENKSYKEWAAEKAGEYTPIDVSSMF